MGGGELKKSNKGQWKRRARQQVTVSRFSDGKTYEEVGQGGLKRERMDKLENLVAEVGEQSAKKGMELKMLYNFLEVVETSRNWSKCINEGYGLEL